MPIGVPRSPTGWRSPRYHVLIRNRVREVREARGIKASELAEQLGVTPQHLDYVEYNQIRPTVDLLARCALLLGVKPWSALVEVEWLSEPEALTTEEILSHVE